MPPFKLKLQPYEESNHQYTSVPGVISLEPPIPHLIRTQTPSLETGRFGLTVGTAASQHAGMLSQN